MKRIHIVLTALLCISLIACVAKIATYAEDGTSTDVDTSTVETENLTAESETAVETENLTTESDNPVETEIQTAESEITAEGENSGAEYSPNTEPEVQAELMADKIVAYVQDHIEELSVIITLLLTVFYQVRKHHVLNKSIATLNNNSIAVTENSQFAIQRALTGMDDVSNTVTYYKNEVASLLADVRQTHEEKKRLETALVNVESYLNTAKLANIELANEVAELLVLANIPNSKKDELYSRHRAAVDAISAAEITSDNPEVKADDRQEA